MDEMCARMTAAVVAALLCAGAPPPARARAPQDLKGTPELGQDAGPGSASETAPAHTFTATLGAGDAYRVSLYLAADQRAGFLTVARGRVRWTSRVYPMWWAQAADLDGDRVDELVLGIWSRTPRHDEPSPHRAVWVMTWDGSRIQPLWRGSALARPLADAFTADLDGDGRAELVALERARAGCVLTAYTWNGFGFGAEASMPIPCAATLDRRARRVRTGTRVLRPYLRRGRIVLS